VAAAVAVRGIRDARLYNPDVVIVDDFVIKPFSASELSVDLRSRTAQRPDGDEVHLTPLEYGWCSIRQRACRRRSNLARYEPGP
jgi:hypothetical protein